MKFRLLLVSVIGILAFSIPFSSDFNTGIFSPARAQAGDAEEYYRFTDPKNEKSTAAGGVIPEMIGVGNLKLENAHLLPPFSGNARISYTLPVPGLVTIRVLHQGTRELYLATILNAEFRDAGRHEELWDGKDYYGNLLDASKTPISYRIQAERVSGSSPPDEYRYVEYAEGESQADVVAKTHFQRHVHGWHESKYEQIPLLKISHPQAGSVQNGKILMKSAVDKERNAFGSKYGYGVRYYVDEQLIHEEFYTPESEGNFSYELDTTAYEDGEHLLYIGMCDHNDHVTSHGISVVFNNFGEVSGIDGVEPTGHP